MACILHVYRKCLHCYTDNIHYALVIHIACLLIVYVTYTYIHYRQSYPIRKYLHCLSKTIWEKKPTCIGTYTLNNRHNFTVIDFPLLCVLYICSIGTYTRNNSIQKKVSYIWHKIFPRMFFTIFI